VPTPLVKKSFVGTYICGLASPLPADSGGSGRNTGVALELSSRRSARRQMIAGLNYDANAAIASSPSSMKA
jgi:hypothetical protein